MQTLHSPEQRAALTTDSVAQIDLSITQTAYDPCQLSAYREASALAKQLAVLTAEAKEVADQCLARHIEGLNRAERSGNAAGFHDVPVKSRPMAEDYIPEMLRPQALGPGMTVDESDWLEREVA